MANQPQNGGSGKVWLVVILLVLFAIAILQNTQAVTVKFLFWAVAIPRAILILISALAGLVLGLLLSARSGKKGGGTT